MTNKHVFALLVVVFLFTASISCSKNGTPQTDPSTPVLGQDAVTTDDNQYPQGHHLQAFGFFKVNPTAQTLIKIPTRNVADHFNILKFLEYNPCTDCIKLKGVEFGTGGTLLIDLTIEHPYEDSYFTAFDLRAIIMFNGSHLFPSHGLTTSDRFLDEGELVNPDGFTTLYNPSTAGHGSKGFIDGKFSTTNLPNCSLNPFKRIMTESPDNNRNAFLAGTEAATTLVIDMPYNEFVFAYAVDACWEPPENFPVIDPYSDFSSNANSTEPWKIIVTEEPVGGGLTHIGGTTKLVIDCYDWQAQEQTHVPIIECGELFSGTKNCEWIESTDEYSRYEVTISNEKPAFTGVYKLLIEKEAVENDDSPDWFDLTAYHVYPITVKPAFNPINVTPESLNINAVDVELDGDFAYILTVDSYWHAVTVFDISDPENPVWVQRLNDLEYFRNMAVSDGLLYLPRDHVLEIYEVQPPLEPVLIGSVETSLQNPIIDIENGYAFLMGSMDSDPYFEIIDIDPAQTPFVVYSGGFDGSTSNYAISANGTTLTLTEGYQLHFFDITDIVNPVETTSILMPSLGYSSEPVILTRDGKAYIGWGSHGVFIYDIDPPTSPSLLGSFDFYGSVYGLAVDGDNVIVTYKEYHNYWHNNGIVTPMHIVDVSDPANPVVSGELAGPGGHIEVRDGYAFFAGWDFQVVDIDPVESPYEVALVGTPGNIFTFEIDGDYAYIVDRYLGLRIVEISQPEMMTVVKTVPVEGYSWGIAVQDGYAYITSLHALEIFDVDPVESTHHIQTINNIQGWDVAVDGDYVFTTNSSGIVAILINPPESASIYHSLLCGDQIRFIEAENGIVLGAKNESVVYVIDADPVESMDIVWTIQTPGEIRAVELRNGHAYIFSDPPGNSVHTFLSVYDVDPPEETHLVCDLVIDIPPDGKVGLDDNLIFIGRSELAILDINPPTNIYSVGLFDLDLYFSDIRVKDNYLYFEESHNMFGVLKLW